LSDGISRARTTRRPRTPSFLILEIYFFIESAKSGDAVDAAKAGASTEDEVSVFLEQDFLVEGDPIGFDIEFALI